jgi:hypothetical protein
MLFTPSLLRKEGAMGDLIRVLEKRVSGDEFIFTACHFVCIKQNSYAILSCF